MVIIQRLNKQIAFGVSNDFISQSLIEISEIKDLINCQKREFIDVLKDSLKLD